MIILWEISSSIWYATNAIVNKQINKLEENLSFTQKLLVHNFNRNWRGNYVQSILFLMDTYNRSCIRRVWFYTSTKEAWSKFVTVTCCNFILWMLCPGFTEIIYIIRSVILEQHNNFFNENIFVVDKTARNKINNKFNL